MPWYEHWKLGRSSESVLSNMDVPVGSVCEPRSETGNYGVNMGVQWILE